MTIPIWTLQDRIRKAREYAGFKQATLAEKIPVARNTVGRWENGTFLPSNVDLHRIAEVTQVSAEWLIYGDDATPQGRADPHLPPSRRLVVEWTERGMVVVPEE